MSRSTIVTGYNFKHVPTDDKRNYVVMKDSSIVYGEKVRGWADGQLGKKVVRIDGKAIPASEVLGFQSGSGYWANVEHNSPARRMITGRISVYWRFVDVGKYSVTYFQKAGGPVKQISGREELKQMLSDCPKAYNMFNITYEEYAKIVKKQPYFLQSVIETYNNCGEWQ